MKKRLNLLLTLLMLLCVFAACDEVVSEDTSTAVTEAVDTANESATAPKTTNAPETTSAPETTKAPETTSVPDTTSTPETTNAPETTEAVHTHTWSAWATTLKATCTAEGKQERICTCGEKESKAVSALGHTEVIDKAVSSTCIEVGKNEGKHCSVCNLVILEQTTLNLADHSYSNDKDKNCNVCGFVRDLSCKHTKTITLSAVNPTCTESGLTEGKKCSECDELIIKQNTVKALGHTEVIDKAIAATCTKQGKTEGKHCSACKVVLVAQDTVSTTDHNYGDWTTTTAATCTVKGRQERSCACGKKETQTINTLGHTEIVDPAVVATCTTEGKTEGKHCSVCNTVIVKQNRVNKITHIKSDWITDKEPTCTTTGSAHQECTMCGKNMQSKSLAQSAHTESDWIIDKEATCKTIGSKHKKCINCNKTIQTQRIEKNSNHTNVVVDEAVAPSCGKTGLSEGKRCTVCKAVITEQITLKATQDHKYVDNFCEVCGKIEPGFSFPSGYITTEPIEIETEYCILKIEENIYIVDNVAEKVDTVCRALEEVTGLKFKNNTLGKDKVVVVITRGDESYNLSGESELTFRAYTDTHTRTVYLSPRSLFITSSSTIVHELAHALHLSQTDMRLDRTLTEGFASYTEIKTLFYLSEHNPDILYYLDTPHWVIDNLEFSEKHLQRLYSKSMEYWLEHDFPYIFDADHGDYVLGMRFMWYLDDVYSDHTKWIISDSNAHEKSSKHNHLTYEKQFELFKQQYDDKVFDGFYAWLKNNADLFDPEMCLKNSIYDLSNVTFITLYPNFDKINDYVDTLKIIYNNLYIDFEEMKKYLRDYKGKFIDCLRLSNIGDISINYYDINGNFLFESSEGLVWLDKEVSYIKLNGSGVLDFSKVLVGNLLVTNYADYAENGFAYKSHEKGTYYELDYVYDCPQTHLVIPSIVNNSPVKIINVYAFSIVPASCEKQLMQVQELTFGEGIEEISCAGIYRSTINKVYLPSTLKSLGLCSFGKKHIDFYYPSTKSDWEAIQKSSNWDKNLTSYTIHCSDGKIEKAKG